MERADAEALGEGERIEVAAYELGEEIVDLARGGACGGRSGAGWFGVCRHGADGTADRSRGKREGVYVVELAHGRRHARVLVAVGLCKVVCCRLVARSAIAVPGTRTTVRGSETTSRFTWVKLAFARRQSRRAWLVEFPR